MLSLTIRKCADCGDWRNEVEDIWFCGDAFEQQFDILPSTTQVVAEIYFLEPDVPAWECCLALYPVAIQVFNDKSHVEYSLEPVTWETLHRLIGQRFWVRII